jgi:formylglycine-generating enzyme required for sulfatase activity
LNYNGSRSDTVEVGSYPDGASVYGALDMAGNVWEWVNDVYDPNYYQISPASNPLGPDSGDYRVLRGGSWSPQNNEVKSTYRYSFVPVKTNGVFGFRCALSSP